MENKMVTVQLFDRWNASRVIFTAEISVDVAEPFRKKALVEAAVKAGADLIGANLIGADLIGADLIGANLIGADLIGADLIGANLIGANLIDANLADADLARANLADADLARANLAGANLIGANLADANLIGANLARANLIGANLIGANLARANLISANLIGANLTRANLIGANLAGADLPSPTVMLLANWGAVSDSLCADLMVFDEANHPDPAAFDAWASGGSCPYTNAKVGRAANFQQKRELWGKGKYCRPYDLMVRAISEKCPDWTAEQTAEFEKHFVQDAK